MRRRLRSSRLLEPLEGRVFLSVAAGNDCPDEVGAAPLRSAAIVTTRAVPNLVGKYSGTITANGLPVAVPSTLIISSQKPDGTITGKISVPKVGMKNFAVKGTMNNKGVFTIKYDKDGLKGTIQGARKGNGHLVGTFSGSATYQGLPLSVSGKFDYTRVG
jgi:hypothetical protein